MNFGQSYLGRFAGSFVSGGLSLFIVIGTLFKFAYEWSHYGKAELLLAYICAVAFMLFLFSAAVFIWSAAGMWKNSDRMRQEDVKSWEEQMELRRVTARKKQQDEAQAADSTKD